MKDYNEQVENELNEEVLVVEPSEKLFTRERVMELLKNTLILFAITFVFGGILGVVHAVTLDPITKMEQKVKDDANKAVFSYAASFKEIPVDTEKMKEFFEGSFDKVDITGVLEAYSSNNDLQGYVIEVTSHEGFGGDIVFSIGIMNNGTTNGISITSISETVGLGMNAAEVLGPQFIERNAETFVLTKENAVLDNEIDAISSATITSKAVVNGVNASICYFKNVLIGGNGNE